LYKAERKLITSAGESDCVLPGRMIMAESFVDTEELGVVVAWEGGEPLCALPFEAVASKSRAESRIDFIVSPIYAYPVH
jgi:hypothetical protein